MQRSIDIYHVQLLFTKYKILKWLIVYGIIYSMTIIALLNLKAYIQVKTTGSQVSLIAKWLRNCLISFC